MRNSLRTSAGSCTTNLTCLYRRGHSAQVIANVTLKILSGQVYIFSQANVDIIHVYKLHRHVLILVGSRSCWCDLVEAYEH